MLTAAVGCAEKTVTVSGKLVLPATVKPAEGDTVTITFTPEEAGKKVSDGIYSASDGTFTAKDVTPGKNKIAIGITPYPGKESQQRAAAAKELSEKYSNKDTKLIYDVGKEPNQSITIDATTGSVSKS